MLSDDDQSTRICVRLSQRLTRRFHCVLENTLVVYVSLTVYYIFYLKRAFDLMHEQLSLNRNDQNQERRS